MSDAINIKALGRRIRQAREARAMAQAQLAEKVDVSVETVSRIERGLISPAFVTVARIAHVLGVTLDDLARGPKTLAAPDRRAVQRVLSLIEDLDDPTLGSLGDFLRSVSSRPRRASRS